MEHQSNIKGTCITEKRTQRTDNRRVQTVSMAKMQKYKKLHVVCWEAMFAVKTRSSSRVYMVTDECITLTTQVG